MRRVRPSDEMERVRRLLETGCTAAQASRESGVPVSTVRRWRRGLTAAFGAPASVAPWRPPDAWSYAYLLGVYLGDGHVTVRHAGHCWLRVFLDRAYPQIIEETWTAMTLTSCGQSVQRYDSGRARMTTLQCAWKRWPDVFPQCGPGRKHERAIALADWQQSVVSAHGAQFVRGLIHSDGCRSVNRFTARLPSGRVAHYAYPRYFFSNLSGDIRRLFCDACDRLGVHWTQSNARNISVADRRSVAILERVVGPKA
jgi:hypothetical protein